MRPRICVSVKADSVGKVSKAIGSSKRLGANLVELRLDYMDEKDILFLHKMVKSSRIGCIATIRPKWDGGAYVGTEASRLKAFEEALEAPFEYVDIEYRSKLVEGVSHLASKRDVGLMLSYHNWRRTPSIKDLEGLFHRMRSIDADVYKIITTIKSPLDEAIVLAFLSRVKGENIISFGMGNSYLTRLLSPLMGGFMTYASFDKALAPGQLTLREMVNLYRRMGVW
ncbi:MAG: type I 3-dehydroquinate dehydratase [Thermoproteota archaeon]